MTNTDAKPRILIVDDVPGNIKILAIRLVADYHIAVATDGPTALQAVTKVKPDLILLDVVMPGMNGYEVCEQLKADKNSCRIPVIFVSGDGSDEERAKGMALGAVNYISKPIDMGALIQMLSGYLNTK